MVNEVNRPQAATIDVALYRDYAPSVSREPRGYSSMPFDGGEGTLALEPVIGSVDLRQPGSLRVQLFPEGSMIHWKVNGE